MHIHLRTSRPSTYLFYIPNFLVILYLLGWKVNMFWQLVVTAAALGMAYYRWSRRRLYGLAREIPSGLNEFPIVGHAHKFLGSSEDRINTIQEFGRIANRQGGLSSLWGGPKLYICTTDPEAIEVVSKACLDKDDLTVKYLRTLLAGSIFAPVNVWHPRRKIMAPFFSLKNLNQLMPVFQEKSSIMADLMRAEVGGGDFPLWKYMTTYSFDTVGETACGTELNSQDNPEHFMLSAIAESLQLITKRTMQLWMCPEAVYRLLPVYKQFTAHLQRVNDFVDKIIQQKRNKVEEYGVQRKDFNKTGWNNFLDVIMETSGAKEKGYSDEELREEVIVVIIAGMDTSAVGTSFTAVLLSRYPEVQDTVYQELREVFGDSDREVTVMDLPKLKYLEAVIKESLRLYPPGPAITREVHKDVLLPSGTTLVEGCSVVLNIWGTHRNPAYWGADAELFRPERFLGGPLRHPAMFIPFSHSVRNCVGATYAMFSMKTALANLLRRYKLLPPANMAAADLKKPLRVTFDVMMKTVDNFTVRVEERKTTN